MSENKNKKNYKKRALRENFHDNRGFLVAYALVAAAIVTILLSGLLVFVSTSHRKTADEVSTQSALQIAESGIHFYKWYLAHELDGRTATQIEDFWSSGSAYGLSEPYEQEIFSSEDPTDPIGKYSLEVELPYPGSTIAIATSTGWTYRDPDLKRSIRVRFRRPSWSEYSVLANDVMRFGEDTIIYGPIHSNNGIRFDGVAYNVITSSVDYYWDPDAWWTLRPGVWTSQADEDSVFLAGKDFPVPAEDFNGVTVDLTYIQGEAESEGLFFPEEYGGWHNSRIGFHISLQTDDEVEVCKVTRYNSSFYNIIHESDCTTYPMPDNGLIFAEGHVWVDGTMDSYHLTIVAADSDAGFDPNIYIENDILYTNKDGQDILGLIAENDITLTHHSENNLEIDAALLAQKGRVGRDYYHQSRDTVTVYGAIATNKRYGFAYTDGTGYTNRNIYFDNNLLYYPPPFFPTGTTYEMDLWEEL